jgi:hypothetical protein
MIRSELTLRLPNSPGALAGICRLLSDEHINIVALSLEASGRLHVIVDNPVRASGALASHHYQVMEQEILFVAVGNQVGGLAPILSLVSDAGVNVNYVYGAGAEGAASAVVVIGVDDVMRASTAVGT